MTVWMNEQVGNVSMVNGGSAGGLRATSFDKVDAGGARGGGSGFTYQDS